MRRFTHEASKLLVGILVLASAGCLGGCFELPYIPLPGPANVLSLDPQHWYILHSLEEPSHPSHDSMGAWSFEFPKTQLGGHVNYVETRFNATMVLHNVTITFKIESDLPEYRVIDPGDHLPATVHLFFEQRNDENNAVGFPFRGKQSEG